MNRTIQFRGRRADGKWLYGDLIHNRGSVYVADDSISDGSDIRGHTDFEVNPETVGQYIGRGDRNGKRIYAGDIICFPVEGWDTFGIVEYSESMAGYCARIIHDFTSTHMLVSIPKQCEVNDNIHDQRIVKLRP